MSIVRYSQESNIIDKKSTRVNSRRTSYVLSILPQVASIIEFAVRRVCIFHDTRAFSFERTRPIIQTCIIVSTAHR